MAMKLSRTSKIGLLVFSAFIILIWGINFLKGRDLLSQEPIFYARYKNVQGLSNSANVELNGFKIGYVRDIVFTDDFTGDLIVKIALFKNLDLPKPTVARIVSLDVLGTKGIRLEPGTNHLSLHQDRDTLTSGNQPDLLKEINDQLLPIKNRAELIMAHADSTLMAIHSVLTPQTTENLKIAIAELTSTLHSLSNNSKIVERVLELNESKLNQSFGNFKSLSDSLLLASGSISSISQNANQFMEELSQSEIKETVSELEQLLAKMNSTQGSVGKFINDSTAHNSMVATSNSLNKLLVDLRQNPKKYINVSAMNFGKSNIIMVPENLPTNDEISFQIHLQDGVEPTQYQLDDLKPFELVEKNKVKSYYSKKTNSFQEASKMLNTAAEYCDNANLIAYKKGKEVSIEKAIKLLSK